MSDSKMTVWACTFFVCVAAVAAIPTDHVISKLDDGPRYQYVATDGAPQLTDTWLTAGSVAKMARYNPDSENVYHLFSRQNPSVSQPMLLNVPEFIASNFDASRPTIVLVHGWDSGPTSPFIQALIPSILAAADVNVIAVDWSAGANSDYLYVVLRNLPISSSSVATFIFWLNLMTGATLNQYHIIGFEVGAHQAGLVGRSLGGQIPYITALEPPRPGFFLNPNALNADDAIYTEAIHTNAAVTGLMQQVANVDFYPNGGTVMPGCQLWEWECSRDRSFQYLAESIVSGGFIGVQCDNVIQGLAGGCESETTLNMGGLTPKTGSTGVFHLTTNEEAPFSL